MQRTISKNILAARFCALMLALLFCLAACGSYSSPGTQPGGTPQATPTNGGYSIIQLLDHERWLFLTPRR